MPVKKLIEVKRLIDGKMVETKHIDIGDIADDIAMILRRDHNIISPDHWIYEFAQKQVDFNNQLVDHIIKLRKEDK